MFEISYEASVFVVGITAVLAALGVILCASPIYCALYLIGNMVCLALLFLLYNAEFLAAVQIIVYAGAVMILFLFIIALLGAKKEALDHSIQRSAAFTFVFLLFGELLLSARVGPTKPIMGSIDEKVIATEGSARVIGLELFSNHLVAFELASALLLVAAVGIICLAKFSFASLRRKAR